MSNLYKRAALASSSLALMLALISCEENTNTTDPALTLLDDPPKVALIAGGKLVVVSFPWYGTGYTVKQLTGVAFPASSPLQFRGALTSPGRDGQSILPPDPDEFQFDPWDDVPEPMDIPFPPDDPFDDIPLPPPPMDDPFDGLPDPPFDLPPLPGGDLPGSDYAPGTVNVSTTGPTDFTKSIGPVPFFTAPGAPQATNAAIPVGAQAAGIVGTPDGLRFLVAYQQGIAVIDRKTRTVVDRIPLPPGSQPYGIAITPDGKTAYVTSFTLSPADVFAVDLASKKVIADFISGAFPARVRVTPDGTQAWFTSFFDSSVQVIDVASNTLGVKIASVTNAWDLKFNHTGTRAYVSGPIGSGDVVNVIDTSTYSVIAKIPVGVNPRSLAVSPSGRHLFVANHGADSIMQIDTFTNKVVRTITVGKNPVGFQFIP